MHLPSSPSAASTQSIIPGRSTLLTDQIRVGGRGGKSCIWKAAGPPGGQLDLVSSVSNRGGEKLEDKFCRGGGQRAPPRFMGWKRKGEWSYDIGKWRWRDERHHKTLSGNERRQNENLRLYGGTQVWMSDYLSPDDCPQLPFPHQNLPD